MVVVVFLCGWALNTRFAIPPQFLKWADRYVINIALPSLILAKISQVDLTAQSAIPIAVAWVSMALCALMVQLIGKRRQWRHFDIGALMLVAVLGNTSFLGIEAVRTLLGDGHVAAAVTYDQLGTFLALSVYGTWIAGVYGSSERGWRPVVRRVLRFTPFLALIVSVLLRGVDIPSAVMTGLSGVGLSVAPVAMGVLGLRFSVKWNPNQKWLVLTALVIKMLIVPAVALLVAYVVGDVQATEWSASLLQSAAPPMVTAGVVAISAGCDEELVVTVVGVGTLVGFVSLPLFSLIL